MSIGQLTKDPVNHNVLLSEYYRPTPGARASCSLDNCSEKHNTCMHTPTILRDDRAFMKVKRRQKQVKYLVVYIGGGGGGFFFLGGGRRRDIRFFFPHMHT